MLEVALVLAAGTLAPWVFNKALDEVSGRFRNFVTTKIKNPQKVFRKVLEETCEEYELSSEGIQSKLQSQNLGKIKRVLQGVLEEELPETHSEFLNEFLLKLLDRLSKKDKERLLTGILVEAGLDLEELKATVARREDLQELKTSLEAYLDSLKKGQEKTYEAISEIKEDVTEIKAELDQVAEKFNESMIFTCPIGEQSESIKKIKTSWLMRFLVPFENALKLQNSKDYSKSVVLFSEILKDIEKERTAHLGDESFIIDHEVNLIETLCFFNLGLNLGHLENYLKAVGFYEKSIFLAKRLRFKSDFVAGNYLNRGIAYTDLKQYEKAIKDYTKAIEFNSKYVDAFYNRGNSYTNLKKYESAIKDYTEAIELNPNYVEAYNNRGAAYADLKQYESAIRDYTKAIKLNPNYAEAYNNRGAAYADLKQYESAINDYTKAIELNPTYATAYYNRGLAYANSKQYESAINDFTKAIELNPNLAEPFGNRGLTYSKLGRYGKSAQDFKKAGLLFFYSGRVDDSILTFSFGFALRDKVESEDIIYCGLALYLAALDPDVLIALRKMQIRDETLRKIFEFVLRKLYGEDISDEIAALELEEERDDMKVLLGLLMSL